MSDLLNGPRYIPPGSVLVDRGLYVFTDPAMAMAYLQYGEREGLLPEVFGGRCVYWKPQESQRRRYRVRYPVRLAAWSLGLSLMVMGLLLHTAGFVGVGVGFVAVAIGHYMVQRRGVSRWPGR